MLIVQRDWSEFLLQDDFVAHAPHTQSLLLQDAMKQLDLDKEAFAARIGVSKKCLGKWMSSPSSSEFRQMNRMAWIFITEIMNRMPEVH